MKPKPEKITENNLMIEKDKIHYLYGITGHAVISTFCGAAMQSGGRVWTNNVNYWGETGIVRHEPFLHLTLDHNAVTCEKCLEESKKKKNRVELV